jgi:hypothetical protein
MFDPFQLAMSRCGPFQAPVLGMEGQTCALPLMHRYIGAAISARNVCRQHDGANFISFDGNF